MNPGLRMLQRVARLLRAGCRSFQLGRMAAKGALAAWVAVALAGCHTDMWVQPKLKPFQPDELFTDGQSAREPVPGTIARGKYVADKSFLTGYDKSGKLVTELPATLTKDGKKLSTKKDLKEVLLWGRERFEAMCSHCHGLSGDGQGMITQRGLILRRAPANYHTDRLRQMPIGHFFEVQTNGFGIMMSSAARVNPDERWAIAAYIRALQLSHNVEKAKLSREDMGKLNEEVVQ